MAKPDTDDGWLKYAHELDAALAVADFTKGQRIVLREVFAQIFGPAKLKTAKVSPTLLGAAVGMDRHNISRAIKDLLDGNVVRRLDDGRFKFNKDYERWLESGRGARPNHRRFTPAEIAWCRRAPTEAMSHKPKGVPMPPTANGIPMDTNEGIPMDTIGRADGIQIDTIGYPDGYQAVSTRIPYDAAPPDPPKENGRAEFKTAETLKTFAASSNSREEDRFAKMPPIPRDDLLPVEHGPHDLTTEDFEAIYRQLWLGYQNGAICKGFYLRQRRHTAAAWRAGIAKCERDGMTPFSIGLLDRKADDFDDEGRSKFDAKAAKKTAAKTKHERRKAGFAKLFPSKPEAETNG